MPEPELDLASTEDALFSRIALSTNPRKSAYLGYRACGFSVMAACDLVPVQHKTVVGWRKSDPDFADFESNRLYELQRNIGPDILRLEFLRNFKLALKGDFKVLNAAALLGVNRGVVGANSEGELETLRAGLTDREFEYLKTIRKHYGPQELLALHKALEPESADEDGKGMLAQVVVIVDGKLVEGEVARRAGTHALLEQFTVNAEMVPEDKGDGDGD